MVEFEHSDLFLKDSITKQIKISFDGGALTNEDLINQEMNLEESLCSEEQLIFGSCEASVLQFKIDNIFVPLINKWLDVSMAVGGFEDSPISIGRYKVFSDKSTADRRYREVVAYDAMYDIINSDVAGWYNALLPGENSTVTLKQFRESFVRHFGLTEILPKGGLVNDNMTVQRTIQPEQISGQDVITAICEINGCFGHIGRDGKFHYIYLPQAIEGLYPSNDLYPDHAPEWMAQAKTGHLYPQDPKSTKIGKGSYIPPCNYESFLTKPITKLQIRLEEDDIGKIWPETPASDRDNCYIIEDNFLVYGKSTDELAVIAQNILGKITDIVYRPFDCNAVGNPCLEVGDPIRLNTKYELVESYILARTMKGIQALRDTYHSEGVEKYSEEVNGVHKSIIQLKGKANILTRTIEETKLEMYDIEKGLNNTISITAAQIRTEVKNTKDGLESSIIQTAAQIRTEVYNADQNLQSQITQNAGQIELRVRKDGVISSINMSPESIVLNANRIDLQGLVNAQELVTKFATISTLNATTANLNNVIAQKATITDLNATNLRVQNLELDHVSVGDLNATNARIDNLDANKINASTVYADFMEVGNWTSAGHIRADRIDAGSIKAEDLNWSSAHGIAATFSRVAIISNFMLFDHQAIWKETKIGTTTIRYLSYS